MKKFGTVLIILGALSIGYWGLYDPMDPETALARYGHRDGRAATTEELLEARETWSPESPSIWFVVGGVVLVLAGLVARQRANRLG
jgi:hypothetical protein